MGKLISLRYAVLAVALMLGGTPAEAQDATPAPQTDAAAATVTSQPFTMPFSEFASPEARAWFIKRVLTPGPTPGPDIAKTREDYAAVDRDRIARMRQRFAVTIERKTIGGVPVQVVHPAGGQTDKNRILINLHGGGFLWGGGTGALVEAIPIAATAGMTVVTVDYRLAPEAHFPAASEDVASVYTDLLRQYPARSIGIYGCSAGAMLTGEAMVWFQRHKIPTPGAIGLFCMGASMTGGDSIWLAPAASDGTPGPPIDWATHPYFIGTDFNDPLVVPLSSDKAMAAFPPTLLISGTRDMGLSSVLATHAALVRNGVAADLHVWDGMWHSFMSDPEPRESGEAYAVVAKFFKTHLSPTGIVGK